MGWARKLWKSPWPTGEGRVPQALQRIGVSGGAGAHAKEAGRGELGRRSISYYSARVLRHAEPTHSWPGVTSRLCEHTVEPVHPQLTLRVCVSSLCPRASLTVRSQVQAACCAGTQARPPHSRGTGATCTPAHPDPVPHTPSRDFTKGKAGLPWIVIAVTTMSHQQSLPFPLPGPAGQSFLLRPNPVLKRFLSLRKAISPQNLQAGRQGGRAQTLMLFRFLFIFYFYVLCGTGH